MSIPKHKKALKQARMFLAGTSGTVGHDDIDNSTWYFHGNLIAYRSQDTEYTYHVSVSNCGYLTKSTARRLHALCSMLGKQFEIKKGVWYIDNKEMPYNTLYRIT